MIAMVKFSIDLPKWILENLDSEQLIYECSKLIREALDILIPMSRTEQNRQIKRAIVRLVLAKIAIETYIACRKSAVNSDITRLRDALSKAFAEVEKVIFGEQQ